jgi:signal transduction histidine kinase
LRFSGPFCRGNRQALNDILEEAERTSQVVDSLMLLARADSGKASLERLPVDACVVVREAAEQGEKLARTHGRDFTVSLPGAPVPIHADCDALRWALLILIDNAVKYTPKRGSIRVKLGTENGFAIASRSREWRRRARPVNREVGR